MPPFFTVDVATDPAARRAKLLLADGDGRHLAAHEVDLAAHPPARWAVAFDTRRHLRRMAGIAPVEQQLGDLGAFLGAEVLGPQIAGHLARPRVVGCGRDPDQQGGPRGANSALEHWQTCLDLLGEIEQMQHALGAGEHEIAGARATRYYPLTRFGELDEARAVLDGCLEIYRRTGNVAREAKALSALADVCDALGDPGQSLALERQALALCERLPDPGTRAVSHNNLALYLRTTGSPDEARAHQLADLVYRLITGLDPRDSLHNLANRIRESASRAERFALPRLAQLVATPAFAALRTFLQERHADLPALQSRIDALEEEARG